MSLAAFGMDTITLAGTLDAKLKASRAAGFTQIMLWAKDLVGHADGLDAAIALVKREREQYGVRITGIQVMRDLEGLDGLLHAHKISTLKGMLRLCEAVRAPVLMVCSSVSAHASGAFDKIARDLSKAATLGVPLGVKVAYEALSWGRYVNDYMDSWTIVQDANRANLGLTLDTYHMMVNDPALKGENKGGERKDGEIDWNVLEQIDVQKLFMVQLGDFMIRSVSDATERIETARHMRVFPGEGAHTREVARLITKLDAIGYRGDYSFEVFNDDYLQMPLASVCARARASALWTVNHILRKGLPLRT